LQSCSKAGRVGSGTVQEWRPRIVVALRQGGCTGEQEWRVAKI